MKIEKNKKLEFVIQGDNINHYQVLWQVTNTGEEAEKANCLRGDFYPSKIINRKKVRKENTLYKGYHYVIAYLIKDNICYGKSDPFEINVT